MKYKSSDKIIKTIIIIKASRAAVDAVDRIDWIYTRQAGGFARQGKGVTVHVIVCRTNLNLRGIFETLDKPILFFVNIFFLTFFLLLP